jgi:hypothetical protein
MFKKRNWFLIIIQLCLFLTGLQAQQTTTTSGGNASGDGGSVSFSVGQMVYTTHTTTGGSVAQGVQQPYEISVVTAIENTENITLACSVYPNPATDFVILKIENYQINHLAYKLYDINSKLIETKKIASNETIISLKNSGSAVYLLKITDNNKEIKTFKIIKN